MAYRMLDIEWNFQNLLFEYRCWFDRRVSGLESNCSQFTCSFMSGWLSDVQAGKRFFSSGFPYTVIQFRNTLENKITSVLKKIGKQTCYNTPKNPYIYHAVTQATKMGNGGAVFL